MLRQYGVEVKTLSEIVRSLALKQGNDKSVYFIRNLVIAAEVWKELFRRTIWEIKTVVLNVCPKKGTITIPNDCERLVNISVIDKYNRIKPLSYNPNINTAEILCQKNKCSCNKCHGENTLCGAVDNITRTTENVEIQGEEYTKTTWIRYDGSGAIQKQEEIPTLDQKTGTVVMQTNVQTICNVEVNSDGCILPTAPNIEAFTTYCGFGAVINNGWDNRHCGWQTNAYRELIPASYNFFGSWNWNAASRDIIHIFHSGRRNCTFINEPGQCNQNGEENEITKVIVSYQTNGETPGEEILIPQYAQYAIEMGIIWRQKKYNPRDGDKDESALRSWRREVQKVNAHLNPIRMDDMIKLQTQPRYW